MRRVVLFVAFLCVTSPAFAKDYSAERFDVSIHAMDDGSVQVTETLRLSFKGGPFTTMSRELPLRRTDGIEVLGASIDGHVMKRGADPGQFEVRTGNSRVAIRWHFAATSDSTHDFRLSYLARGIVQQTSSGSVLEWQAHPTEHSYPIASSRIVLDGVAADREPDVRARRVADARAERTATGWAIEANGIGSNGWVMISAPATVAAGVMPMWQQREREQRAMAPRMIQMAATAAALCVLVLFLIWRQSPPPPLVDGNGAVDAPPAPRAPAIAAAILAGGHSINAHAPGTLFDLASRNVVTVAEATHTWKPRRRFTLTRSEGHALAPHETALLDVMFKDDRMVDFSKAASRLARGGRAFRHAVNEELYRLGLTDDDRRATRRRFLVAALVMAIAAGAATAVVIPTNAGPWSAMIPATFALAAALAGALGVTRVELSDEGFREREQWRAFKKGLSESMASAPPMGSQSPTLRFLPFVAALGLAMPLSRYLKKHGANAMLPPWFRTLGGDDGSAAFAAFIGTTSSATSGGAAASGAAGGGSSSAG